MKLVEVNAMLHYARTHFREMRHIFPPYFVRFILRFHRYAKARFCSHNQSKDFTNEEVRKTYNHLNRLILC